MCINSIDSDICKDRHTEWSDDVWTWYVKTPEDSVTSFQDNRNLENPDGVID